MKSEIVFDNGTAVLKINGEKVPFSSYRSFHPQKKFVNDFYNHGYRVFNVFPSGIMTALANRTIPYSQFGPVWVGENEYNWDNLKKQTDLFAKACPEGYCALMIHLDTPDWFTEKYGIKNTWNEFIQEAENPLWREAAAEYMCALMDKADEFLPGRIYGFFLMAGGTTEWYTRDFKEAFDNPTETQINSYRHWINDKNAQIPDYARFSSVQNGIFTEDKNVLDYRRYLNEATAETLSFFADKAKKHCKGERAVGAFFGYACSDCANVVLYSDNDAAKIYKNNDINIIACPASYDFRKLDSTSCFRLPVDSLTLHKKLYIHEIDSKTHLAHKNKLALTHMSGIDDTFHNLEETSAYLRREVAMTVSKGQGYWIFDMFGGLFDEKDMMNEVENLRKFAQEVSTAPKQSMSETALFIDLESNYYVGSDADYPMNSLQLRNMNLCGFPWDIYLTDDLCEDNFDFNRYKLYIFPNLFKAKPEIAEKIQYLRNSGKCILFMHAPGYISDGGFDAEKVRSLTGITLKEYRRKSTCTVLNDTSEEFNFSEEVNAWRKMRGEKRKDNNFKPIYYIGDECEILGRYKEDGSPSLGIRYRRDGGFDAYSSAAPLTPDIMRKIAKKAGVFSYIASGNVIYMNSAMAGIYSFEEGISNVRWPYKAVLKDWYSSDKYEVDENGTDIPFKKHETRLFTVEADS